MALVAYYEFATDFSDSVGSAHLSIGAGSASIGATSGPDGGGALVNPQSGWLQSAAGSIPLSGSAGSLSLWVNPTGDGSGGTATGFVSLSDSAHVAAVVAGRSLLGTGNIRGGFFGTAVDVGPPLALNEWVHLAYTWDATGETTKVYHNGTEVFSAAYSAPPTLNGRIIVGGIVSGAAGASNVSHSVLDKIGLYSHALTQEEVEALANLGGGGGGFQAAWAAGSNQVIQ